MEVLTTEIKLSWRLSRVLACGLKLSNTSRHIRRRWRPKVQVTLTTRAYILRCHSFNDQHNRNGSPLARNSHRKVEWFSSLCAHLNEQTQS